MMNFSLLPFLLFLANLNVNYEKSAGWINFDFLSKPDFANFFMNVSIGFFIFL